MAEITLLSASVTVGDESNVADVLAYVETTRTETDLDVDITVDPAAVLAAAATYRRVGVTLSIDLGSGTLTEMSPSEIGPEFGISESVDGYADQLTFSLLGEKWSPMFRALIRARRAVRVTITFGEPGAEVTRTIFNGRISSGTYDAVNLRANITALDEAIHYSEKLVSISIDPDEGKTRLGVLTSILADNGVPIGEIRLGSAGSRVLQKGHTAAETRLFDFLRDFLTPAVGHPERVYFRDGLFHAAPLDLSAPPITALTIRVLVAPFTMDVPSTTDPTVVTAVSVRFDRQEIGGLRTETLIESVFTVYGPKGAVETLAGGTVDYSWDEAYREVARIITKTTYRGSTPVRVQTDTLGWYAPLAAPQYRDNTGTVNDRVGVPVYKYADGTWRFGAVETFRLVSRTIVEKVTDVENRIVTEKEKRYFWHVMRSSYDQIVLGTPTPHLTSVWVMGDGEGSVYEIEAFESSNGAATKYPDEQTITQYEIDDDGVITRETVTRYYHSPGAEVVPEAEGSYVYGLANQRYFTNVDERADNVGFYAEGWYYGKEETIKSYRQLTEEKYRISETTTSTEGNRSVRVIEVIGARPLISSIQPETRSQELRATVRDEIRIGLNGEITVYIHNEFCETEDELEAVALGMLRELSALPVTFEVPIEGRIHKGHAVTVDFPRVGLNTQKLFVTNISRRFGARGFAEQITAKLYPAEVI